MPTCPCLRPCALPGWPRERSGATRRRVVVPDLRVVLMPLLAQPRTGLEKRAPKFVD